MRIRTTLVGLMMVAAAVLVPAQSVSGAENGQQVAQRASAIKQYVSGYRMAWVPEFNLCLGVYMKGSISATMTTSTTVGGTMLYKLHSPELIDPYMLVTTKKSCDDSSAPKKKHTINVMTHRMYAYGYKCSFDPSFSVSIPWSIGVGATPDCGDERVAKYGQTQTRATHKYRFELITDGYALGWDQSDGDIGPGYDMKLCTSMSGDFVLKDSKGPQVKTVVKRVAMPDFCVHQKS